MDKTEYTLVLGGGGVAVIAWEIGLLAGLSHHGLDLRGAQAILGTSAGSAVGAQISSGASLEQLYEEQLAGVPFEITRSFRRSDLARYLLASVLPGGLEGTARRLGHYALNSIVGSPEERRAVVEQRLPRHEWPMADLRLVVVDAETGRHRILRRSDGACLVDAVAASCAVPMVWPPVRIDHHAYIDGGARSPVNLDLAPGTGPVVALAPMTWSFARAGRINAQKRALNGRPVEIIVPSEETKKAQGRNGLDKRVVPAVARAGWKQAEQELHRIRAALHLG